MKRALTALAVALFPLAAGCPDRTVAEVPPTLSGQINKTIPVSADIDILFVIDDSKSTSDKQDAFTANFKNFIAELDKFPTGRPNVHIGVITTSVDIGVSLGGTPSCHPATTGDGRLHATGKASCSPLTNSEPFISDIGDDSGHRTINYHAVDNGSGNGSGSGSGSAEDPLASAFTCLATVGDDGCGFESPLEALKRALDGTHPENKDFIRPGAFLAVVILTDEDDCSTEDKSLFTLDAATAGPQDFRCSQFAYTCDQTISPSVGGTYTNCKVRTSSYLKDPTDYATFLSTIKDPSQTVVALIAGDPETTIMTGPIVGTDQNLGLEPSCMAMFGSDSGIGRPGIRLHDFLDQFGEHGLFQTVCQSDYSTTLTDIGKLLFDAVSPCLDGPIDVADVDPKNPGVQPDCSVIDTTNLNTPDETEFLMHACKMTDATTPAPDGTRPCWWVAPSAMDCKATPSQLEMHIERSSPAATGTEVQVACAVGP